MRKKFETICEESIKILVDSFYEKVRGHKELGPLFENQIGAAEEKWEPHLQNMSRKVRISRVVCDMDYTIVAHAEYSLSSNPIAGRTHHPLTSIAGRIIR